MPKTRNNTPQKIRPVDLSYARAATLMLPVYDRLRLVLVGCGGTGSWLAPSVARIARLQRDQGREVEVIFFDHDEVEPKNIPRQNFCDAELGRNKAVTLAARFSAAWGVEISAIPRRFNEDNFHPEYESLTLLIGCVDNAAARKEMNKAADWSGACWLDCGNEESSGQVVVGSETDAGDLEGAFTPSCKICKKLPAPSLVAPDLLEARPEELAASKVSCAEIAVANAQSLAVNQMVASVATDYLLRLLTGGLKRFATYFDLESGSMRSRYITVNEISCVIKKPVEYLIQEPKAKKEAA